MLLAALAMGTRFDGEVRISREIATFGVLLRCTEL
jgi:hypothetical protein